MEHFPSDGRNLRLFFKRLEESDLRRHTFVVNINHILSRSRDYGSYLSKCLGSSTTDRERFLRNDWCLFRDIVFSARTRRERGRPVGEASSDLASRLSRKKSLLRESDKPGGISHSDSPCIARSANVALFNSVRRSPLRSGRPSASRGTPWKKSGVLAVP